MFNRNIVISLVFWLIIFFLHFKWVNVVHKLHSILYGLVIFKKKTSKYKKTKLKIHNNYSDVNQYLLYCMFNRNVLSYDANNFPCFLG